MEEAVIFEEQLNQVIKELSHQKIKEVIEYANFLRWKEKKEIVEFDEWALNLAKEKGFYSLTEEDVARIVHETRKEDR